MVLISSDDFSSMTALLTVYGACVKMGTRESPFVLLSLLWPVIDSWFSKIHDNIYSSTTHVGEQPCFELIFQPESVLVLYQMALGLCSDLLVSLPYAELRLIHKTIEDLVFLPWSSRESPNRVR